VAAREWVSKVEAALEEGWAAATATGADWAGWMTEGAVAGGVGLAAEEEKSGGGAEVAPGPRAQAGVRATHRSAEPRR
jgi:hypothetical protein